MAAIPWHGFLAVSHKPEAPGTASMSHFTFAIFHFALNGK